MKTKTPSWNDFRSEKRRQLKEAHPELSEKELMREVSRLWKEEGHSLASKTSNTRKNTEASMPRNRAKLEIPLITETRPDEAAGWDVAEGLFDGLMARANANDRASLLARANQAYARAKGEVSQEDQTEWELGYDLVETFVLVMARRGVTADQWARLFPKELGTQSGLVSGVVETGAGLLGLGVDVNEDGQQSSIGTAVGGVVEGVTQGVLNFMDQEQ